MLTSERCKAILCKIVGRGKLREGQELPIILFPPDMVTLSYYQGREPVTCCALVCDLVNGICLYKSDVLIVGERRFVIVGVRSSNLEKDAGGAAVHFDLIADLRPWLGELEVST